MLVINMNKKYILIISIVLIVIALGALFYKKDKESENQDNNTAISKEELKVENVIYEYDKGINLFINKYNEINQNEIKKEMISKKHIKGTDRNNVVNIKNDKLEINIYDNYSINNNYNISVYVGYTQIKSEQEDYKSQFVKYIKLFDNNLTNEQIDYYWNDMLSSYRSNYTINDIDILTLVNNGVISYFKFTKNFYSVKSSM